MILEEKMADQKLLFKNYECLARGDEKLTFLCRPIDDEAIYPHDDDGNGTDWHGGS
jgi:hypothetical protein